MRKVLIFIFMMSILALQAQEYILVLESNPLLKTTQKKMSKMRTTSSLSLPFLDDFSYNSYFPDNLLWEDSSVFINRSYPVNPVTIGVATFDGLDANGMAYDILASTQGKRADSLTSKAIDLSAVDSAYLLFYYQAEGLGDNPQTEDSLVLEFLSGIDTLGLPIWQHIWSIAGQSTQEFQRMEFNIKGANYLHTEFRFRFRNYATLSGNYDHWHIDYVKVDAYSAGQIPDLNDITFVYENPKLLKRYREMPWVQFVNYESVEMVDSINPLIRNNEAGISVDYRYNVFENNLLIDSFPYIGTGWRNYNNIQEYSIIGNYSHDPIVLIDDSKFISSQVDTVIFKMQHIIKTTPNDYKNNDTLSHYQKFNSNYAYDDGVAEFAYGMNVQGAKMAYQFELNKTDSLRMIQIYFAPMQSNVSNIPFYLIVWEDNNGLPGNVLLRDTVYPVYEERTNFHNYYLSTPIGLDGVFYVGIEQTTNDMLNVGLDRNSLANNYMFYNVGGGWHYSQFPGAWMIRPVLRGTPIISSSNNQLKQDDIQIFPNPFSDFTTILIDNSAKNLILLFDISGRLISKFRVNKKSFQLSKNNLKSGVYILQVQNKKEVFRKKLVIQ
jgi:hypothetical protein